MRQPAPVADPALVPQACEAVARDYRTHSARNAAGEAVASVQSLTVRFEPGTELKVREIDLRRLAAELVRTQPRGTAIEVSTLDLSELSQFVMSAQVTGATERDSLLDPRQPVVEADLRVQLELLVARLGGEHGDHEERAIAPRELGARPEVADGIEERTIVLAVERNTKHLEPMLYDGNE